MNGLSALEYLKKFFHEIVKGRKDYENLLPMIIGINTNKYNNHVQLLIFFDREPLKNGFHYTTRQNWTLTYIHK